MAINKAAANCKANAGTFCSFGIAGMPQTKLMNDRRVMEKIHKYAHDYENKFYSRRNLCPKE